MKAVIILLRIVGVICVLAGSIFTIQHWPMAQMTSFTGILLLAIAFYLQKSRKRSAGQREI